MCDGVRSSVTVKPEYELARLVEREMGMAVGHIDSVALRLMLRANWREITSLAHRIHEAR